MVSSHDTGIQRIDYYFGAVPFRVAKRVWTIGISSLVVSILSIILDGTLFCLSLKETSEAARNIRQLSAMGPFKVGFGDELSYDLSRWTSMILAAPFLLSILLLFAAAMLLRSNRRGLTLHWIYVPLQLVASIPFVILTFLLIGDFTGGIVLCLGVAVSLLSLTYPLYLIRLLRRAK